MDEISVLLAQNVPRSENLLTRALAQLQSISAEVHFESAAIDIPNDAEAEPMTPPIKYIRVDPIGFDTTKKNIANISPAYHAGDNRLLDSNPCSRDTKDALITTYPPLHQFHYFKFLHHA